VSSCKDLEQDLKIEQPAESSAPAKEMTQTTTPKPDPTTITPSNLSSPSKSHVAEHKQKSCGHDHSRIGTYVCPCIIPTYGHVYMAHTIFANTYVFMSSYPSLQLIIMGTYSKFLSKDMYARYP